MSPPLAFNFWEARRVSSPLTLGGGYAFFFHVIFICFLSGLSGFSFPYLGLSERVVPYKVLSLFSFSFFENLIFVVPLRALTFF